MCQDLISSLLQTGLHGMSYISGPMPPDGAASAVRLPRTMGFFHGIFRSAPPRITHCLTGAAPALVMQVRPVPSTGPNAPPASFYNSTAATPPPGPRCLLRDLAHSATGCRSWHCGSCSPPLFLLHPWSPLSTCPYPSPTAGTDPQYCSTPPLPQTCQSDHGDGQDGQGLVQRLVVLERFYCDTGW
jgi:hypothetical protein